MPEPVAAKPTLYLDTTSDMLHLAIGTPQRILATDRHVSSSHRHHSAVIIPKAQVLLAQAGIEAKGLGAIGVVHGPGSFTGVRTGLITARTLAQFLDVPVHVFNRFELVAEHARLLGEDRSVSVYIDALRGRAYRAVVKLSDTGADYITPPALIPLANHTPDEHSALWVSSGLVDAFPELTPQAIPADLDTPALMHGLIGRYGSAFARPWQDVHPLYLQEPNITLRKAKPGAS